MVLRAYVAADPLTENHRYDKRYLKTINRYQCWKIRRVTLSVHGILRNSKNIE